MTELVTIPAQVALEDSAITSFAIQATEEDFIFQVSTGVLIRRLHLAPKHAKRVLLLLQSYIEAYEKQFGELKTSLPLGENVGNKVGFQIPEAPSGVASVQGEHLT